MSASNYDRGVPEFLFCEIVAGEIPASTALDSDRTTAFRLVFTNGRGGGQAVSRACGRELDGRPTTWPPG